jgi:hypothetical protein
MLCQMIDFGTQNYYMIYWSDVEIFFSYVWHERLTYGPMHIENFKVPVATHGHMLVNY